MYRSDRPAPGPRVDSDIASTLPSSPAPVHSEPVRPRPDPARERRFEPAAPSPSNQSAGRSWFATGLYLMALPMTLGVSLMLAPVSWMLGARAKR